MAAKVYTFHISYEGLAEKIWRNIAVSSNYRLDQLGYAVLAAFDTMAYHLFEFHYKDGRFEIPNEDADEDALMEAALEAGAEDFSSDEDAFEITTDPSDLRAVREALEGLGYKIASAEEDKIPQTYVTLTDPDAIKNMNNLLEHLEDCDDVQEVYHNWENADEE